MSPNKQEFDTSFHTEYDFNHVENEKRKAEEIYEIFGGSARRARRAKNKKIKYKNKK